MDQTEEDPLWYKGHLLSMVLIGLPTSRSPLLSHNSYFHHSIAILGEILHSDVISMTIGIECIGHSQLQTSDNSSGKGRLMVVPQLVIT